MNLEEIRTNYSMMELDEKIVNENPMEQFKTWLQAAMDAEALEPTAATLSTVSKDMQPSSRVILLKEVTESGFVFYTNYESKKGMEMVFNPKVSLLFMWKELQRQLRIEGTVSKIDQNKSKKYFQSRPRGSQLSAWASEQSATVISRDYLEHQKQNLTLKFKDEDPLPLPDFWGGYEVIPSYFEFWQGRMDRLHDRIVYRQAEDAKWKIERLAP